MTAPCVMYPSVLCVQNYVIYMICSFPRYISFYGLLSLGLSGRASKYAVKFCHVFEELTSDQAYLILMILFILLAK